MIKYWKQSNQFNLDGTVCHEFSDVAVVGYLDVISERVAGNDERKVEKIAGLLAYNVNVTRCVCLIYGKE